MPKTFNKVVFKADNDEFQVIVNGEEYQKWIKGDKTIPLSEVVDSFSVFTTGQGKEGIMGQASKQQLENAFGSSKDVDVVTEILEKGQMQEVSGGDKKYSSTNDSQRGGNSVSRGAQGGYGGR